MDKTPIKAILDKYVQGTATPAEQELVEQWYNSFHEEDLLQPPHQKEVLRRDIISGIMRQLPAPPARNRIRWKAAAVVAALIMSAAALFIYKGKRVAPQAPQLVAAPAGSRNRVTLADGTTVLLNAGTQLSIPANYGVNERIVTLSGEAFFDVATDAGHPFTINTGSLQTIVLGTSFNIRAYNNQEEYQVAVATGKVKVLDAGKIIAASLTANRQLAYGLQSKETVVSDLPAAMAGAWRKNIFYFNNSTLQEIGAELERQYNIPVTVTGAAKNNGHYKISFAREPLSKVLKVLAGLTGITYTIQEKEVIIQAQKTK